ncbi:MAG: hypothetical protein CO030_02020 [Candidatus Magasanikbacteria bacterium CG_4_9_14_0_2_um_filter_42_11]|uniref:Uncharacterized protein n=1 Tax=Candidatus Magasanikbacteria bacterium CG_4_9_14_0_2_um_filter_42_11 TaxID=1974643 RepID=A0A2M8FAA8_9BACT|nr:MAG: hypothetical protein COU34_02940 [Candidatus Magasanikbacteria bacterium CG10_big_fil_rev_8_21_14_0_10_43_9]PJC52599.1 MAG: hypothetical protein CO030_02020 [Candidatus Magasanikbacteria bacterium CG_4_9_14_0_2_um_filter_42_11]
MFFVIDTILNAVFFYEKPESYSPFLFVTKKEQKVSGERTRLCCPCVAAKKVFIASGVGSDSFPLETPMDMIKLFYQRYHLVAVQFV